MPERFDVEFTADGGVTLRAWFYLPEGSGPFPAISMAHGFAGTRAHRLGAYAEFWASRGYAVLLHDHRNFGGSDGRPRHDIDPWQQIADWRRAISYLESRDEVDSDRIGLWGTSYAGGHVLVIAATDPRVKAVVSQVPAISGFIAGTRRVNPDDTPALERSFIADERSQAAGAEPATVAIAAADRSIPASYRSQGAIDFYAHLDEEDGDWANRVTLRSNKRARMYEPGVWVSRISPTPLLMLVATHDELTATDLELEAYEAALEPKSLVLLPGGHFDPYTTHFDTSSSAALDWFDKHLQ